jgi:uncharacterized protein (TIGR00297 family)
MNLLIGLIFSFIIAFPALKKQSLSKSGFVAALILGSLIYYSSGILGFSTMIIFFISSSIISKKNKYEEKDNRILDKGSCRDYIQVLANGIVALLFSLVFKITNNNIFLIGVIISFASSNADTWASEIGIMSKDIPRYIFSKKPVSRGLSGGVTKLGFISSLLGSLLIACWFTLLSSIINGFTLNSVINLIIISISGFIGALIDSILGETVQVKYISWKDKDLITERSEEDSKKNKIVSGISFFDNNLVNFTSVLISSLIGICLVLLS